MANTTEMAFAQLRYFRDEKLKRSDVPWGLADFDHPNKSQWLSYRQALRDLTKNSQPTLDENNVLQNIEWPVQPNTESE